MPRYLNPASYLVCNIVLLVSEMFSLRFKNKKANRATRWDDQASAPSEDLQMVLSKLRTGPEPSRNFVRVCSEPGALIQRVMFDIAFVLTDPDNRDILSDARAMYSVMLLDC